MRIVSWYDSLIHKIRAQSLDYAPGCEIIRVTRDSDRVINRLYERRDCETCLQGITAPPKGLGDLKADVTSTNTDMFSISDAKIDVTDI